MTELILNPKTTKQLDMAKSNLSHAYLFCGPRGLGKTTTAEKFAGEILGPLASPGDQSRWILTVTPLEGKAISSAQAKKIRQFISSKKPDHINYKVIIVDSADHMGIEATNSLLLSLEEPASDTVIIMVTDKPEAMLPTILSRLQKISFLPPLSEQLDGLYSELGIDSTVAKQIGPYPGLLGDFAQKGADWYSQQDALALDFIEAGLAGRLKIVANVADKSEALQLVELLSLKTRQETGIDKAWLKRANSLILAHIHLYNNGNPKFVLEKLALEFE